MKIFADGSVGFVLDDGRALILKKGEADYEEMVFRLVKRPFAGRAVSEDDEARILQEARERLRASEKYEALMGALDMEVSFTAETPRRSTR